MSTSERVLAFTAIGPKTHTRLADWADPDEAARRQPAPHLAFSKAWKVACINAGCPGRIPHDLRRIAVRNLVRRGVPERVAMKLTGHKTPSVFQRYNIAIDGDLRTAAQQLFGLTQFDRTASAR